jgi:hypothetical protein
MDSIRQFKGAITAIMDPLTPEECAALFDVINTAQNLYVQGGCSIARQSEGPDL